MFLDFVYWLVWICLRTIYCPPHSEFRNYSVFAWWYCYVQLISGEVEYTTVYNNIYLHPGLAMTIIGCFLCCMATFVKTTLFIRVHKIEPMHTSSTINMHQRFKNLFLNGAYTNCQGSWNLVGRLNHNWRNPLPPGFIPVHKIGAMHTSSTINMHPRHKNQFLNGTYTNCQGSWNLVGGLNHNWRNPLQHGYICEKLFVHSST
jgi:hypothetical protein